MENKSIVYEKKKVLSFEPIIFIFCLLLLFVLIGFKMGTANMISTILATAYDLLMNTVLYIMAIAVLTGALSGLLNEFGVVALINKILSPLIKPIYGMPGASCIGIFTTYLSDNPAIITLADDFNFRRYFKKYQLPALTNIGTAFGMGLIITTFIVGTVGINDKSCFVAVLVGNIGALIGSVVSTRLMLVKTKKLYGSDEDAVVELKGVVLHNNERIVRKGGFGNRLLEAVLEGGKNGVNIGLAIIPGVLVICTFVLLLTNGASADGIYTGGVGEGVALLPLIAQKIDFILTPLFGFSSPEAIAVPITALGSAGAAISLIPEMVVNGTVSGNDIAVFTAMCMCWSGYLSTHVAMMDSLHFRNLIGHAILAHTIAGIVAGISTHLIYVVLI